MFRKVTNTFDHQVTINNKKTKWYIKKYMKLINKIHNKKQL